jgi:putative tryptophan/tyrosine transport system substrate-binding protein
MIGRREFVSLLGGAAAAWPLAGHAQQPTVPMVGFLSGVSPDKYGFALRPFREGLSRIGYVEDRNVVIIYRWEGGQDALPGLAADLVHRQVTVIVASGNSQALAAKAATTSIPIVFLSGNDPVELGFVASLNRPGGNLTGVTTLGGALALKRLELVHEVVPTAIIAHLVNPSNSAAGTQTKELQIAARALGLQLHNVHAASDRDIENVFATLARLNAGALIIVPDGFLISRSQQLASLALRHAVPAFFQNREFAAAGGLISYGGSSGDAWHLVGAYTGRVLKGEKPRDLPVQQATKVELVINLKTAKALGLEIPPTLLARADEVIE